MEIRAERNTDLADIRALLLEAFSDCAEANLVEHLRNDGSVVLSFVAIVDNYIVGHILFSRMERPAGGLALAPVAVRAPRRRKGIAASLIRYGLERAREDGWAAVFVLGDPSYYSRFGFDAALAEGLSSPYAGPHLMALALRADGMCERSGELVYPRAFGMLG